MTMATRIAVMSQGILQQIDYALNNSMINPTTSLWLALSAHRQ
jgi:ABC-type sugar transport system ATPase subunit